MVSICTSCINLISRIFISAAIYKKLGKCWSSKLNLRNTQPSVCAAGGLRRNNSDKTRRLPSIYINIYTYKLCAPCDQKTLRRRRHSKTRFSVPLQTPDLFKSLAPATVILWSTRADVHLRSLSLCEYIIYCWSARRTKHSSRVIEFLLRPGIWCAPKYKTAAGCVVNKQHNEILNWARTRRKR